MASTTRGRQLWLIPVLVVVIALTAVGALIARDRYREPAPVQESAVLPSPTPMPPSAQPGSRQVVGTEDATSHPLYEPTRALLQSFFDAINTKNYDKWRDNVTKARSDAAPEADWRHDYRSTNDGTIVIYRIETGVTGTARVLLSFVSTQNLADAPPELPAKCISWHVVFPLTVEGGSWKVDTGPTGQSPQHDAC